MTWISMGPWLAGTLTTLACFTAGWEMQARRAPSCRCWRAPDRP